MRVAISFMTVRLMVELMPPGTIVCGCGYFPQMRT